MAAQSWGDLRRHLQDSTLTEVAYVIDHLATPDSWSPEDQEQVDKIFARD